MSTSSIAIDKNLNLLSTLLLYILLLSPLYISNCHSQATCGGNANGASCVFPFIYGGVEFNQCTYYGRTQRWCATTSNYDDDKVYGYCDCPYNDEPFTPAPTNTISGQHPHFIYTQGTLNNGVLRGVIINLLFADDLDAHIINISTADYDNTVQSIQQYYLDSSFGKLSYTFQFIEKNYVSSLPARTVSTGEIALEAYKFAEQDGYIWCNGICGDDGKLYRDNDKHFDQIVVVVHDQADLGNSDFGYWAGLGLFYD